MIMIPVDFSSAIVASDSFDVWPTDLMLLPCFAKVNDQKWKAQEGERPTLASELGRI